MVSTGLERGLFGLEHSNAKFDQRGTGGWGKNKFNNAFPIALCNYMYSRNFDLPYITVETSNEVLNLDRKRITIPELYGELPENCFFEFEGVSPYFSEFVYGSPNKSDVIVHRRDHDALRALEIKLTVVPDQTTLGFPRASQASEFVTRPLMIELLATNLCRAFGEGGRPRLNQLILKGLGNPNNWDWTNENEMHSKLRQIKRAIELVLSDSQITQVPMVMQPIWRTIGDSMRLDEHCFDCFIWSDFGLASLYVQSVSRNIEATGSELSISRESRSAIWLVKMLWDYSTAGQLTMSNVIKQIAYANQQDKAGAFTGRIMLDYLNGPELSYPRVKRDELSKIILNGGESYLNPERRLDAAIYAESLINTASNGI